MNVKPVPDAVVLFRIVEAVTLVGDVLAPEEYVMGDALGEDTTVYKLGALAFEFFGDNADRSRDAWKGPAALYPVAERATRDNRKQRYAAVREFLTAWRDGVSQTRL